MKQLSRIIKDLFYMPPVEEVRPITLNDLMELLTDFQLECDGVDHSIAVIPFFDGLGLKYEYIPWNGDKPASYIMQIMRSDDFNRISVMHNEVMRRLHRTAPRAPTAPALSLVPHPQLGQ